jgi:hypothetical protein
MDRIGKTAWMGGIAIGTVTEEITKRGKVSYRIACSPEAVKRHGRPEMLVMRASVEFPCEGIFEEKMTLAEMMRDARRLDQFGGDATLARRYGR